MLNLFMLPQFPACNEFHFVQHEYPFLLLKLFVSFATIGYTHSIARKNIRHMKSEEGKELEEVKSILLRPECEPFTVRYKLLHAQILGGSQDSMCTTTIKLSIRKTLSNSIVRPVWEGQLNNICQSCYDDLPLFAQCALPDEMNQTESSSGLAFSLMLGDTINKLHKEIDALRTENKNLEANTLRWKSTSEKLSNQWESEKSELTGRFLTLFNEHKARHVETLKELNQVKGKKQRTDAPIIRSNQRSTSVSGNRRKSRDTLPDDEDQHDYAIYDDDEVNRLASGQRRQSSDRKPSASQKKQKSQSYKSQGSAGFVNPHTGATEYSNPKELFSSDEDDDMKL